MTLVRCQDGWAGTGVIGTTWSQRPGTSRAEHSIVLPGGAGALGARGLLPPGRAPARSFALFERQVGDRQPPTALQGEVNQEVQALGPGKKAVHDVLYDAG